jgi:hypothetical protein
VSISVDIPVVKQAKTNRSCKEKSMLEGEALKLSKPHDDPKIRTPNDLFSSISLLRTRPGGFRGTQDRNQL